MTDTQSGPGPAELVALMPFAVELGIELDSATAEAVEGHLAWRRELCTAGGLLHGGALMSFADTVGAVCAVLNLPAGAGTATISSATSLLSGVRQGEVVSASARPLRVGRSVIVVATDLRTADGRPVAHTVQSQAVLSG